MSSIDVFKSWLVFLKPLTAPAGAPEPEKQHPPEKDLDNLARNLGDVATSFDRAAAALAVIAASKEPRVKVSKRAGDDYQPWFKRPKVDDADDFRSAYPTPAYETTPIDDDRRLKLRAMDLSEQLTALATKSRSAQSRATDFSRRVHDPAAPPPPVPLGGSAAEKAARKAQAEAEELEAQVKSIEVLMRLRDKHGTTAENKAGLQKQIDEAVARLTPSEAQAPTPAKTAGKKVATEDDEKKEHLAFGDVAKQAVHAAQHTLETAREKVDIDHPDADTERMLRDVDLLVARARLMQEHLEGVLRG